MDNIVFRWYNLFNCYLYNGVRKLANILVMYQSKYGATQKYAEWLAEKL